MNEATDKDAIPAPYRRIPRRLRIATFALAAAVSGSACSAPPESSPDRAMHPDKPMARVDQPSDTPAVTSAEVPEAMMQRVRAQLAVDTDAADTAQLIRAEQVIFNDGSLGCPEPGAYYTMATVPGYQVVFEVAGEIFDYRVNMQGIVKRCIGRSNSGTTTPSQ